MNEDKVINDMLFAVSGSRLGDRDVLPTQKRDFISEDTKKHLLGQWSSAGRDAALVYAKLVESDGTAFYVTGWDGKNAYAGFEAGKGFGYLPASRLQRAKLDESWSPDATLGFVRQSLCEMEQTEISDLLDKLKRAVTKRSKGRRKNEFKNFIKRFEKMADQVADAPEEPAEPVSESMAEKAKHSERRANFFKHRGRNAPVKRGFVVKPWDRDDVPGLRPLLDKKTVQREIESDLRARSADKKVAESEQNEVAAEMRKFAKASDWKRSPLKKGK